MAGGPGPAFETGFHVRYEAYFCDGGWPTSEMRVPHISPLRCGIVRITPKQSRLRSLPRIHDGHSRLVILAPIASNDREAVMQGCRGDRQIRLGECVTSFPAFLDQKPLLEQNIFRNRENTTVKHRPHLVRQPLMQFGPADGVGNKPVS